MMAHEVNLQQFENDPDIFGSGSRLGTPKIAWV
jgi:hypothetical protein